jgi:hypothetical protein
LFADPVALARYVSAVIAGMGVLASSGSDRDELRQVALVSLKVFDERSGTKTAQKERKAVPACTATRSCSASLVPRRPLPGATPRRAHRTESDNSRVVLPGPSAAEKIESNACQPRVKVLMSLMSNCGLMYRKISCSRRSGHDPISGGSNDDRRLEEKINIFTRRRDLSVALAARAQ